MPSRREPTPSPDRLAEGGGVDDALARHLDQARPSEGLEDARVRSVVAARLFGGTREPLRIDRFTLIEPLGRGGMGEVWAAYDPRLDRKIAIKVLRPDYADRSSVASARLVREAQLAGRLSHPNLVSVFDVGVSEGRVYLAMEYIDGPDLARWLDAGRPSAELVLDVFVQAGRGLAEAHRHGVVFRDFKPANVMLQLDAATPRARVVDFGLARLGAAQESAASLDDRPPSKGSLTTTGRRLGTPAYMAPEQHAGVADARSDQFAFCLSLAEALTGRRPLAGAAGLEPEVMAAIPPPLRAPIRRGLSVDPDRRWPDMDSLLAALRPRRRRSRWRWAGLPLLGSTAALAWWASLSAPPPCTLAEERLAELWSPARRRLLEQATLASGAPHAADTWERVRDQLDAYLARWAEVHDRACLPGDPLVTPALRRERASCLDEELALADQLLELLEGGSEGVVEAAVRTVYGLPSADDCADVTQLQQRVVLAARPEDQERVEALRRELARVQIIETMGRLDEAMTRLDPLIDRARSLGHGPTLADGLRLMGQLEVRHTDRTHEGIALLEESYWTADASGADRLRAMVASTLAYHVSADLGDYERAMRWARHGFAAAERLGPHGDAAAAALHRSVGALHQQRGRLDLAEASLRAAVDAFTRSYGRRHLLTQQAALDLGGTLLDRLRHEEALPILEEVVEVYREVLGPTHPDLGRALIELGRVHEHRGDDERALGYFERALELWELTRGLDSPRLIRALNAIGRVQSRLGRFDRALLAYRRAHEITQEVWGPIHRYAVSSAVNIGEVHLAAERPELALEACDSALTTLRALEQVEPALVAEVLVCRSEAWWQLGNVEGALADATDAWQECQDERCRPSLRARAGRALATPLLWRGRAAEAEPIVDAALRELPPTARAYRHLRATLLSLRAASAPPP
ncbi:MAG: serine/threonine protein kinase [Myxococcales bacterium]|nr:serine/threonine protein kinase [Myxococcales bacterium]